MDKKFSSLVSLALGFSQEFVYDDTTDVLFPDGSWTALIGLVNRSEVDIAVANLYITEQRSETVSFSYPFQY